MTATINASTTAGVVTTADTSGILQLQTNGTAALTIDAVQNVGIGTATPRDVAEYVSLGLNDTTGGLLDFYANGTRVGGIIGVSGNLQIGTATATPLIFNTDTNERMRIDSSGNVGIGTTSPNYLTTFFKASLPALQLANSTSGSTASDGFLIYLNGANATISNEEAGYINFQTSGTERARIESGGSLLMTTARSTARGRVDIPDTGGTQSVPLAVSRGGDAGTMVNFFSTNSTTTTIGTIGNSGNTNTTYNTSSDYRLKEDIAPMTGALAKVALLKPSIYRWKSTGATDEGFIAHELAEVCPSAVTGEKDAVDEDGNIVPQGIDTSFLVATLTAAIQEQQALITQLQADVAALKSQP